MTETIVLYHGGCRDGFCAAWVVNKYFTDNHLPTTTEPKPNIEYIPVYYGQDPPDVIGKDVIIVDFCYPLEMMKKIESKCKSLVWLDHHKTAIEVAQWFEQFRLSKTKYLFDNLRSGAGIAWDYFFPNEPCSWLVNYVEDRDLWLKNLDNSDIINAYIACLEFDFRVWDEISKLDLSIILERGLTAELKTQQYVREVCKNVYFRDIYRSRDSAYPEKYIPGDGIAWSNIPIVNICQIDCSEVLHELCKRYLNSPFSVYWFKRADGLYQYGLRSIGDFDVSEVAKVFGGGGHKNAAGFQLTYLLEELK